MGNLIHYTSKLLPTSPDPSFLFLTNCIIYLGTKPDYLKLHRNYTRLHLGKSFFCLKSELKRISQFTKLDSYEDLVFTYFTIKSMAKVNLMEIFASIITFAEVNWTEKVSLAFTLFDFDGNKTITEDELFIMCRCFVDAVALITNGSGCSNFGIKELVETSEKVLTLDEYLLRRLIDWVQSTPSIFKFLNSVSVSVEFEQLKKLEPSPKILIVKKKFNKSFDKTRLDKKTFKRRTNSSLGYSKNEKFMVVVSGSPVTKAHLTLLKNIYESVINKSKVFGILLIKELHKLNYKDLGKVTKSSQYSSFRSFLSDLFHKADPGQIDRMIELLGSNF